jgi:DNA-binding FadR family transcriptional regulator
MSEDDLERNRAGNPEPAPKQPPDPSTKLSTVQVVVETLREEILSRQDGELLGSEDELLQQLGVSRPTFRQASKIIESEQLLRIRRGKHGGFYAQRPTAASISRVAGTYLRARNTNQRHLHFASAAILSQAAALAAGSGDQQKLEALQDFVDRTSHPGETPPRNALQAFLADQREFFRLIYQLADNPVLELFNTVNFEYSRTFVTAGVFSRHLDRAIEYARERTRLAESITGKDPVLAGIYAARCSEVVYHWMVADESAHETI